MSPTRSNGRSYQRGEAASSSGGGAAAAAGITIRSNRVRAQMAAAEAVFICLGVSRVLCPPRCRVMLKKIRPPRQEKSIKS